MSKPRRTIAIPNKLAEKAQFSKQFNSPGIVYQDSAGRIITANPAAEQLLGLKLEEMQAHTLRELPINAIHEDGSKFPAEDFPNGETTADVIMGICHPMPASFSWIRINTEKNLYPDFERPGLVVMIIEDLTEIKQAEKLLRTGEERFKTLIETSSDSILLTDLDGHFLTANPQTFEMLGYDNFQDLKNSGLNGFDYFVGLAWLKSKAELLKSLMENSPRLCECEISRRNGSKFPAQVGLALLVDPDKNPYGVLSISRDITHSKRGESELRKLSQAVVQSGDSVIITDPDGHIEYVNPQFEKRTGYALSETLGKNPSMLNSGQNSQEILRELWQTIKSGQIWRGELLNKRKDGSLLWEEVVISPVIDQAGVVSNFVAINTEITERKQIENDMRIKDSAIESSINAILMTDLSGNFTYVNQAFLRLGWFSKMEDVIGKSVTTFWQEEIPSGLEIQSLLEKGSWQGELSIRRSDGARVEVAVSAHLVRDDAGKPLCMMSSLLDITARKQAEAAEREERRLAEALRKTAEALSSTLKLDDLLDLILEVAGQVIENDSISIMLIEGQKLKVVSHHGYAERGMRNYIETANFKMADYPLLALMLTTRKPCIIPDVRNSPLWKDYPKSAWIHSYAGVPIAKREEVIGFLNLNSSTTNFFTFDQSSRLQAFASQVGVAIENARLYEQDHILSITDGLTGLHTSRYFFELAKLEFERSRRYKNDLSLVMIDVDHFKLVNDNFGHLVGDDVLREIARRVRSCLRVVDIAARFGGEEFVLLMVQTSLSKAYQVAERVRKTIAGSPIEVPGGQKIWVTVSMGVATQTSEHDNLDRLIKSADDALYEAKAAGRNLSLVWQHED